MMMGGKHMVDTSGLDPRQLEVWNTERMMTRKSFKILNEKRALTTSRLIGIRGLKTRSVVSERRFRMAGRLIFEKCQGPKHRREIMMLIQDMDDVTDSEVRPDVCLCDIRENELKAKDPNLLLLFRLGIRHTLFNEQDDCSLNDETYRRLEKWLDLNDPVDFEIDSDWKLSHAESIIFPRLSCSFLPLDMEDTKLMLTESMSMCPGNRIVGRFTPILSGSLFAANMFGMRIANKCRMGLPIISFIISRRSFSFARELIADWASRALLNCDCQILHRDEERLEKELRWTREMWLQHDKNSMYPHFGRLCILSSVSHQDAVWWPLNAIKHSKDIEDFEPLKSSYLNRLHRHNSEFGGAALLLRDHAHIETIENLIRKRFHFFLRRLFQLFVDSEFHYSTRSSQITHVSDLAEIRPAHVVAYGYLAGNVVFGADWFTKDRKTQRWALSLLQMEWRELVQWIVIHGKEGIKNLQWQDPLDRKALKKKFNLGWPTKTRKGKLVLDWRFFEGILDAEEYKE